MQFVHENIAMIKFPSIGSYEFFAISSPKIQNVTNKKEFMI
jgi:hypothetical protein